MTYEVERQQLIIAAGTWQDAASDLTGAQSTANGITVTTNDASIIATMVDFTGRYDEIRDRVATLLGEGAAAVAKVDDTLRSIEKQYRLDDEGALRRIGDEWSPEKE
jgi:hypothetical protein